MSDTMFNSPDQGTNEPAQQQADQASLFKVGDRSYDADSAAKKIENADAFIEQLKDEKRQLEAKLQQSTNLEDALSMFQQQQQQQQPQQAAQTEPVDMEALKAQLLEEARKTAQSQATDIWQQQQASASAEANLSDSMNALKNAYGTDYQERALARGAELGYDQAGIDSLARTNPKVFKELFVPKAPQPSPTPHSQNRGQSHQSDPQLADIIPDFRNSWSSGDKVTQLFEAEAKIAEMLKDGKLKF